MSVNVQSSTKPGFSLVLNQLKFMFRSSITKLHFGTSEVSEINIKKWFLYHSILFGKGLNALHKILKLKYSFEKILMRCLL